MLLKTLVSLSTLLLLSATLIAGAQAVPKDLYADAIYADSIYYDGYVLTGQSLTSEPEHVSAFAVRNGFISAIGSDTTVLQLKGPHTSVTDLKGAFVMPGFNDAHVHLGFAGRQKLAVDLDGVQTRQEMMARIRAAAEKTPGNTWLQGGGWDHTLWPDHKLPTREELDAVTGEHPAFFERTDGHIGISNTLGLKAAGIDNNTPDPQGGKYDHAGDKPGAPLTGIVRDTAMAAYEKHLPKPTMEQRRAALTLVLADLAAHGITSAQDNSDWEDFQAMESLERDGKLTARISEWLAFSDPLDVLKQHRAAHPDNDRMLHTGMLKGFMDGSLGSRTAALNAPYADDPKNAGLPRYTQAQLDSMTVERMGAGFQIGFHAIGDRAVEMALNAFSKGEAAHPAARALRPRIEHSQVLDAGDFARYQQLGVIASMQPSHLLTDQNWAEARLGHARARYSYAWKSFLDHGVPLAFGTDYPVEPITPFRGLYSAVTRLSDVHPTKPYFPEEALTIGAAIYAYTQGSAYAEFSEEWKGRLVVHGGEPTRVLKGHLVASCVADFVILDRNLLNIPPAEILNAQVLRTVVGGRTVYQQGAASQP